MAKTLYEIHEDVPANHYDKGVKNNLFQRYWHQKRFHVVLALIDEVNGPILDIGCHAGLFTQKLAKKTKSKSIYGIDISKQAIISAKKRIPSGHFKVADAHTLPFASQFFNAVFCLEMLEHVDHPARVLTEIKRVLKKDGFGLLLVPTDNKLFKLLWFTWTMYYPVWKHAHVQSFQGDSLERLLKKVGLKVLQVKKTHFGMLKIVIFSKR